MEDAIGFMKFPIIIASLLLLSVATEEK